MLENEKHIINTVSSHGGSREFPGSPYHHPMVISLEPGPECIIGMGIHGCP